MLREILIPKGWPKVTQMFVGIALENWIRYALFAGIAWLLAYLLFKKRWWLRKIIQRDPTSSDVRREVKYSLLTALIYGLVGSATIVLARHGGSQFYGRIESHGWAWFIGSIGIAIIVHDTWFYWTHRLMHHRRLFRLFHRVHHESTNPSPWAAYSFAPLEATVQAGIFPLLVFTLPMHPLAFFAFMIWQITFNVIGHTGYEYHPHRPGGVVNQDALPVCTLVLVARPGLAGRSCHKPCLLSPAGQRAANHQPAMVEAIVLMTVCAVKAESGNA